MSNRSLLSRALTTLLATAFAGCSSHQLLISTDPDRAQVEIRDGEGTRRVKGPSVVDFNPEGSTRIVVRSPADEEDRFLDADVELTLAKFMGLPLSPDGRTRKLHVPLEERQFVNLTYVDVVLDARRRWRGLITQSRSFREITEVGGMLPTRIVTLDPRLGITGLALSPDGTRIVYSLASYSVQVPELMTTLPVDDSRLIALRGCNLRGVSTDVGGIQQISSEDFLDMFPAFTPDGNNLLFSSNRRRRELADILRISYAGRSAVSNIYINPNDAMSVKPTQAKDGTIAFAVYPDDASKAQVWTVGGKFEFPTQVTNGTEPAISPDGTKIAFIGLDDNLWVTDSDGSNQVQLTTSADRIAKAYYASLNPNEKQLFDWSVKNGIRPISPFSFPSWSADGKNVVYSGMEGNDNTGRPNEDIWMMQYDGNAKQQLTTNGSADRFPLMSPDGRHIYFLSNRGKAWAIWRVESPSIR